MTSAARLGPLLDEHHRFDDLLLRHQALLVDRQPRESAVMLHAFRSALEAHLEQEERMILPAYDDLGAHPKGGESRYFRKEHDKIRRLLVESALWVGAWAGRDRWPAREVVRLVERQKLLKEVLEHHDEREREILYPLLESRLAPDAAADLARRFAAAAAAGEQEKRDRTPPAGAEVALDAARQWLEPIYALLAAGGTRPRRPAPWDAALERLRASRGAPAREAIDILVDGLEGDTPFKAFPTGRVAEVRAAWHLLGAARRALAAGCSD